MVAFIQTPPTGGTLSGGII